MDGRWAILHIRHKYPKVKSGVVRVPIPIMEVFMQNGCNRSVVGGLCFVPQNYISRSKNPYRKAPTPLTFHRARALRSGMIRPREHATHQYGTPILACMTGMYGAGFE